METSEFIKVDDRISTRVDVRFIAAFNRKLQQEVNDGKFREDLFYRLNVFAIELPPLRERKADIPLLTQYFIAWFATKTNKKITDTTKEAAAILYRCEWKANTRELKNIIERAVILEDGVCLTVASLPYDLQYSFSSAENNYDLSLVEKQHILKVLQHTNGNKTEAARLLNIGLITLYRKIEEYNIK